MLNKNKNKKRKFTKKTFELVFILTSNVVDMSLCLSDGCVIELVC